MQVSDEQLKEIIARSNLVKKEDLDTSLQTAKTQQKSLGDVLIQKGLITEEYLTKIIAEVLGVEYIDLKSIKIPQEIINLIPEEMAQTYHIVAFKKDNNVLHLAMENPSEYEVIDFIRKKTGYNIKPYLSNIRDIDQALGFYKSDIRKDFAKIIEENIAQSKSATSVEENVSKIAQDLPVTRITDTILEYAIATCPATTTASTMSTAVVPTYVSSMPVDPSNVDYTVCKDTNGRITVSAPGAELDVTISVTR